MVGCCVRHVHVARQEGVGETGKYSESSGKNRALKNKALKSTKGAPGHEQEGHGVAAADFEGCRHDNDEPGEETRETGGKKHLPWTKQLLEEAAKEGKNHWRNILKCS